MFGSLSIFIAVALYRILRPQSRPLAPTRSCVARMDLGGNTVWQMLRQHPNCQNIGQRMSDRLVFRKDCTPIIGGFRVG